MKTIIIEVKGELTAEQQEGGYCASAFLVGGNSLECLLGEVLGARWSERGSYDFGDAPLGECKLRLEIEVPEVTA